MVKEHEKGAYQRGQCWLGMASCSMDCSGKILHFVVDW